MNRHSETGLKLIKSSQYVEDSVVTNGPDLGPVLNADFAASVALWRASQPAAMAPTAFCFTDVLLILKDRLAASRRWLAGVDRAHVANVRHLMEMRAVATKVKGTFSSKMGATRRTFEEHFPGSESAFVLAGFQSPTSADTTQLLEQGGTVLERIKSPGFVLPEPLTRAVKVDPEELIAELESDLELLQSADEDLRLARREVQKSRKEKNRAVKEHGELFLRISRTLESYYLMAGEPELAAQIRPSGRRPGRRAVEVAEEEGNQASTSGSAPDEPASDAPTSDGPASDQPASDGPATDQQAAGEAADSSATAEAAAPAEASESSDSESSAADDAS